MRRARARRRRQPRDVVRGRHAGGVIGALGADRLRRHDAGAGAADAGRRRRTAARRSRRSAPRSRQAGPATSVRVEPGVYREHVDARRRRRPASRAMPGTVTIAARRRRRRTPALTIERRASTCRVARHPDRARSAPVDIGVRVAAPAAHARPGRDRRADSPRRSSCLAGLVGHRSRQPDRRRRRASSRCQTRRTRRSSIRC